MIDAASVDIATAELTIFGRSKFGLFRNKDLFVMGMDLEQSLNIFVDLIILYS